MLASSALALAALASATDFATNFATDSATDFCSVVPQSCFCNCTSLHHTAATCLQPKGSQADCDCVTGKGCWSKPKPATPTVPSCALTSLKVCIAARSGRGGHYIPLGSICAPRCPAGFMNTSEYCPSVPADVTETALDCLYHQNPLKPTDKGYNKSCACPGNMAPDGSPTCTCLSACALTGCAPTPGACGPGRTCSARSQFHVCLFPWDVAACGPPGVVTASTAENVSGTIATDMEETEITEEDWLARVAMGGGSNVLFTTMEQLAQQKQTASGRV